MYLNDTLVIKDSIPEIPSKNLLDYKFKIMKEQIAKGEWDSFIKPPNPKGPDRFPRTPQSMSPVPMVAGD